MLENAKVCACLRKDPTCKQLSSKSIKKAHGYNPLLKNQQLMGDGRDVSAAALQATSTKQTY